MERIYLEKACRSCTGGSFQRLCQSLGRFPLGIASIFPLRMLRERISSDCKTTFPSLCTNTGIFHYWEEGDGQKSVFWGCSLVCGYLKLKFKDVGEEVGTRGQKGDAEDRSFVVIIPLFLMVQGWIPSPLKNWEQYYFHSVFLNDHMGGDKCELLLYLEKFVGVYECPKAGIHPSWDSGFTWEKELELIYLLHWLFKRNWQELCP